MRRYFFFISFISFLLLYNSKPIAAAPAGNDVKRRQQWVDSVYHRLNDTERIGQLFMIAAYSGGPNANQEFIEKLLNAHQIGGLIFMQGGAGRQATLTNRYQKMAQVPLLLAMDAEWGLGMRLDSIVNLPRQMMLGATHDTTLAYNMGMTIAYQCKRLGVHIDFAPVVDVNNNPDNPVINFRSFGEDKKWVARMGIAYMKGLQENGVMACAKHFPGHGDVSVDSHKDLPVITKSMAQLDTLELYPFRQLIAAGVQSIMVAHLSIPALETEPLVPTTLSRNTVTNLLRRKLNFGGLIFTDALNMQGVAKNFGAGEASLRAFLAGNDVLLFPQDVPAAIRRIKWAVDSGKVTSADLEHRVKKVLAAKYDAGLASFTPVKTEHITEDINRYTASLNQKIADAALTVVRDQKNLIGNLDKLPRGKLGPLCILMNAPLDDSGTNALDNAGWHQGVFTKGKNADSIQLMLRDYSPVLINLHGLTLYPGSNYGLDAGQIRFLAMAANNPNTVIAVMANAYALKYVCKAPSLIVGYEDNQWTQAALQSLLTGSLKVNGRLPVTPPCMTGH